MKALESSTPRWPSSPPWRAIDRSSSWMPRQGRAPRKEKHHLDWNVFPDTQVSYPLQSQPLILRHHSVCYCSVGADGYLFILFWLTNWSYSDSCQHLRPSQCLLTQCCLWLLCWCKGQVRCSPSGWTTWRGLISFPRPHIYPLFYSLGYVFCWFRFSRCLGNSHKGLALGTGPCWSHSEATRVIHGLAVNARCCWICPVGSAPLESCSWTLSPFICFSISFCFPAFLSSTIVAWKWTVCDRCDLFSENSKYVDS